MTRNCAVVAFPPLDPLKILCVCFYDSFRYQEKPNDKAWNKLLEVIRNDSLREIEKEKTAYAQRQIGIATKIIAK